MVKTIQMRQAIAVFLSLVLIAGAVFISRKIISNKKKPEQKVEKIIKSVFTQEVKNQEIPLVITTSGQLVAKNKIDLYAEVQGILEKSDKDFRVGTSYREGETIFSINHDEFFASIQSQKSTLFTAISSALPDLKYDFPNEFQKWQDYLHTFDLNRPIPVLPAMSSDKEKFFISAKGVLSQYYAIKNAEVKLNKYIIRAPFNGVVTEANVLQGSLIRPGMKLGEFINPNVYEMEVPVNVAHQDILRIGNTVTLKNLEHTKTYTGRVSRLQGKVDAATQTIKAFVQVTGKSLKEGMYLEAELIAKKEKDVFEIDRKLLTDNQVFAVRDTVLELVQVNPIHFTDKTVFVKGLPDGIHILSKTVPGAHNGMRIKKLN